jgi:hypothetical protein
VNVNKARFIALGSFFITGVILLLVGVAWFEAQNFKTIVTNAGFTNVELVDSTSSKATVMLHGCKLGIDDDNTGDATRVINGHDTSPFNVSSVSDTGTWAAVPELTNKASSPDEVAAFLAAHREQYPCYK